MSDGNINLSQCCPGMFTNLLNQFSPFKLLKSNLKLICQRFMCTFYLFGICHILTEITTDYVIFMFVTIIAMTATVMLYCTQILF